MNELDIEMIQWTFEFKYAENSPVSHVSRTKLPDVILIQIIPGRKYKNTKMKRSIAEPETENNI